MTTEKDQMLKRKLIGAWNLIGCTATLENELQVYPLGRSPSGILIYSETGRMCVSISADHRLVFNTTELTEVKNEEAKEAFGSYVGYGGTYTVLDGKVFHHVTSALFPDWIGTDLIRNIDLSDESTLKLTDTSWQYRTIQGAIELVWRPFERN